MDRREVVEIVGFLMGDGSSVAHLRVNRNRMWTDIEDFVTLAPAYGSAREDWARKNGMDQDEIERIAVLAKRLSALARSLSA